MKSQKVHFAHLDIERSYFCVLSRSLEVWNNTV